MAGSVIATRKGKRGTEGKRETKGKKGNASKRY